MGVSLEGGGAVDVKESPLKVSLSPSLEELVRLRLAGFEDSGVSGGRVWLEGLMGAGYVVLRSVRVVSFRCGRSVLFQGRVSFPKACKVDDSFRFGSNKGGVWIPKERGGAGRVGGSARFWSDEEVSEPAGRG